MLIQLQKRSKGLSSAGSIDEFINHYGHEEAPEQHNEGVKQIEQGKNSYLDLIKERDALDELNHQLEQKLKLKDKQLEN